MSRPLLSLVLLASAAGCVRVPKIDPGAAPTFARTVSAEPVLRVMTLNIAHATGVPQVGGFVQQRTRSDFLEAIGALVRREGATVVAMQEVHRPTEGASGLDHLSRIQRVSGYADGFFGTHLVATEKGREQGTALLSNLPLGSPSSRALNHGPGDDKGYVRATLSVPQWLGREVDVYSVHLDPFSEEKRLKQVLSLADALRDRTRPAIVMGDFNAKYRGPFRTIGRLLTLTDLRAHDLAGGDATFPAFWPRNRIDWILATPELEFVRHRNVNAGVSDHQGVVAELRLAAPPIQMAERASSPAPSQRAETQP